MKPVRKYSNKGFRIVASNHHRGWDIWYNGRHWKASQWGVEMSAQTFDQAVNMIDQRIQSVACHRGTI